MSTGNDTEKVLCTWILMMFAYGVINTLTTGELLHWLVIPVAAVVLIWVGQALNRSD